jgi:hypothetical protein
MIEDGDWVRDSDGDVIASKLSSLEARLFASLLVILADQLDNDYS